MKAEPKHILVVEDESAQRHVLAFNLEKAGYRVTLAGNPCIALQLAERHDFDLIISDYCMPYCPGTDLIRKLRESEDRADIPVVFWTAKAEELSLQESGNDFPDTVVSKSSSMAHLLDVVSRCLSTASCAP